MPLSLDQLRTYHREGKSNIVLNHIRNKLENGPQNIEFSILYAEILLDKGLIGECLQYINKLLDLDFLQMKQKIHLEIMKAEILTDRGEFREAQKLIRKIKGYLLEEKSLKKWVSSRLLLTLGKINYYSGNLETAENFLHEAEKFLLKSNNPEGLGRIYTILAQIAKNKGNFKKSLDTLLRAEKLETLSYFEQMELKLFNAQLHIELSNLKEAETLAFQIEAKIRETGYAYLNGQIFHILGNINKMRGNFNQSLAFLSRAEEVFEKQRYKYFQFQTYQLKGEVNFQIGNFATAMENFQKALSLATQLENEKAKTLSILEIAKIIQFQGNLRIAEDYFWNALKIIKDTDFVLVKAKTIFHLGIILLIRKKREKAIVLIQRLRKIFDDTKSPIVMAYFTYLQSLDYFYKPRFIDKEIAKQGFMRLLYSNETDTEIKINSALRLSQLLIMELKLSENQEILEDLNQASKVFDEIAHRENSLLLKAFLSILQAKIALVNFDFNRSKEILTNLKDVVRKENNRFLLNYIDQEETQMEEEFLKWYDAMKKNPSFVERIEKAQILDYISEISKLVKF